jgi:choline dehydrogenase-like flavoprotein
MPLISNIENLPELAFDFVIVGGGSAGCVLASRLSEDNACKVLLVESGAYSRHPLIRVPTGVGIIWKQRLFDWQLNSTETPSLNQRKIELMRGKVLGGSSAINAMSHVRGAPADYDGWYDAGCDGWSYDEVAPFFRKSENWIGPPTDHRGCGGPISVSPAQSVDPLYEAWFEAAKSCGHKVIEDYNALPHGVPLEGFARSQQTIGNGYRVTASSAYLEGQQNRPNLCILTQTHVTRINFVGNRAQQIDVISGRDRCQKSFVIDGTLILSAGAFYTPHILMHSGIGPEKVLRQAGLSLRHKSEAVGRNYRDHIAVQINFRRSQKGEFHRQMRLDQLMVQFPMAALFGRGSATRLPGAMHGFVRLESSNASPDIQFLFRGAPKHAAPWWPIISSGYEDGFGIRPVLLHPTSHGTVEAVNTNPLNAPRIDGHYLQTTDDMERLLEGVDIALTLADDNALGPFRKDRKSPIPSKREQRIDWIRQTAVTAHHPCGTCRMGPDESDPLTTDLRLRGFDNLLVVDASAFPRTVSGNINACVYMMAEKIAETLKSPSP